MLSGEEIINEIKNGNIIIKPFDKKRVNPNSYNMTLGDELLTYTSDILDCKTTNDVRTIKIPKEGYILSPGILYIAKTVEYTESCVYIPQLSGRSSIGRIGVTVHLCSGFGSIGYKGAWSLGITCIRPTKVYPGMDICQIYFFPIVGNVGKKYGGKHQNKDEVGPSKSYQDFVNKEVQN